MENKTSRFQTEEEFDIKEFLQTCLVKWYWFALSVTIALSIGIYKIATTHPSYTRYTDILIKSNEQGGDMGAQMEKFASMGTFRGNTTVFNEIYAIQSPANVMEVVKRLGLNMDYYCNGLFHRNVLYGANLPVKATICNIPDDTYAKFTIDLHKDGTYKLYDFIGTDYKTGEEITEKNIVEGRLSITATAEENATDTVETPIGKIHIAPMPHYIQGEDITIYVTKNSLHYTTSRYQSLLSFVLKDKDTDIITIAINDQSIQRADDILRTLIEVYNECWVEDKNKIADSTSEFINERLKYISKELDNVDSEISSYKSKNLLPNVDVASNMYMSQSRDINNKILDLKNELEMTQAVKDYLTNEDTKNKILPANVGISDLSIEQQISEYNRNMLQRNSLVASSSTQNPLVIDLDNSLEAMRQGIITSINNQLQGLHTQINNLEKEIAQTNAQIAKNPSQSKYLESAGREQTVKATLYLFLLQKREENQLSKAFTAYNTRIITPATGSNIPTGPRSKRLLIFSLAIGLFVPAAYILIREYFNTKIRGRKDLERIDIPIVGEIPFIGKRRQHLSFRKENENLKLIISDGNHNVINEAFRVLRTNIEFLIKEKEKNVMICTSFNPGSGKSFTVINLAASLALKKRKVLLIDGDMRHASLSTYAGQSRTGLSNYLAEMCDNIEQIIIHNSISEGIDLIPAGVIPPNPTELLESNRLGELIQKIKTEYDYVIIDCPPIDLVADTSIIEKHTDRTLFIVRSSLLERRMLSELDKIHSDNRFKAMSLIINGIEQKYGRYGYGYGYGYGYSYHQKN